MQDSIRWLTVIGWVLGIAVVLYGLVRYFTDGAIGGLIIALAILIVGPGEDLLENWVKQRAPTPEQGEVWATIVDRATSAIFLFLLGLVVLFHP